MEHTAPPAGKPADEARCMRLQCAPQTARGPRGGHAARGHPGHGFSYQAITARVTAVGVAERLSHSASANAWSICSSGYLCETIASNGYLCRVRWRKSSAV